MERVAGVELKRRCYRQIAIAVSNEQQGYETDDGITPSQMLNVYLNTFGQNLWVNRP